MKFLRVEKWWLIIAIGLYVVYMMPGLPAYGDAKGAVIHNLFFFAAMWICNYGFNAKISKIYKPAKTTEEFLKENAEMDRARAEAAAKEEAELIAAREAKKG